MRCARPDRLAEWPPDEPWLDEDDEDEEPEDDDEEDEDDDTETWQVARGSA